MSWGTSLWGKMNWEARSVFILYNPPMMTILPLISDVLVTEEGSGTAFLLADKGRNPFPMAFEAVNVWDRAL